MKKFNRLSVQLFLALTVPWCMASNAQINVSDAELVQAEIRQINENKQSVTLKHEEIKSIDMPAMTMRFFVKDKAMLEGFTVGDQVLFSVNVVDQNLIIQTLKKGK